MAAFSQCLALTSAPFHACLITISPFFFITTIHDEISDDATTRRGTAHAGRGALPRRVKALCAKPREARAAHCLSAGAYGRRHWPPASPCRLFSASSPRLMAALYYVAMGRRADGAVSRMGIWPRSRCRRSPHLGDRFSPSDDTPTRSL